MEFSGLNCAEAVNFAPADWLPHGGSGAELYRLYHKPAVISHEELLCVVAKVAFLLSFLPFFFFFWVLFTFSLLFYLLQVFNYRKRLYYLFQKKKKRTLSGIQYKSGINSKCISLPCQPQIYWFTSAKLVFFITHT